MNKILFFLLFALTTFALDASAQLLTVPATTLLPHLYLPIAYNSTTVLIFPTAVDEADRGTRDILAQKQTGLENVLKLKAARRNFPPTNLHIFTADSHVYAFDVYYTDSLAGTYILRFVDSSTIIPKSRPVILFFPRSTNTTAMKGFLAAIRITKPFLHARTHKFLMTLRLASIHQAAGLLFFRFIVSNRSDLDFLPDFSRLYITDRRKAKRTSVQEHEILPVYKDSLLPIASHSFAGFILAVPRFTIPDGKVFRIELYERNGGRNLSLAIKNKAILRSKQLDHGN